MQCEGNTDYARMLKKINGNLMQVTVGNEAETVESSRTPSDFTGEHGLEVHRCHGTGNAGQRKKSISSVAVVLDHGVFSVTVSRHIDLLQWVSLTCFLPHFRCTIFDCFLLCLREATVTFFATSIKTEKS